MGKMSLCSTQPTFISLHLQKTFLKSGVMAKANKKSPKEASKTFHDIMKASVNPKLKAVTPPKKKQDKK
jgi:hypothetical protein